MIRAESIRYKVLRNNAEYAEIFTGNNTPTLRMASSGEIKMSLQGTFLPKAIDTNGKETDVDWMKDEIMPVLSIDGVEKPLCILLPAKVEPATNRGVETLSVQAYDRCWLIKDNRLESRLHLGAGTLYLDVVEGLLTSCGIGTILKTASSAALTEDREDWDVGTSYLTIINDLLSEINYKQLWFDASGNAIIEPASVPTAENIKHIFTNRKPDPRNPKEVGIVSVHPNMSKRTDIYESPNVFICVCSNADKSGVLSAKAENTNPQSPLSIPRRGRRIVKYVQVNNTASQQELQAYANKLMNDSMLTGEIIQVDTALLHDFGVDDVTAIQYDDLIGVCVEQSWTMALQVGGKMTHELQRVVINLG